MTANDLPAENLDERARYPGNDDEDEGREESEDPRLLAVRGRIRPTGPERRERQRDVRDRHGGWLPDQSGRVPHLPDDDRDDHVRRLQDTDAEGHAESPAVASARGKEPENDHVGQH